MLPEKIILATGNANKAREFEQLLDGLHVEAMPAGFELPPETGSTFEENARLKVESVRAQYLAKTTATGEVPPWIMADDSGIEIKAFAGAPGIYSARYAGEDATDVDNVNKLLAELKDSDDRRARFVCVIVCCSPDGGEIVARGDFDGTIASEPYGEFGFGYDPVFVPDNYSLTVSQLSAEEKNRISHRARAAHSLLAQLRGG
ncbi:MAG: RdgB/HAM1 family non-canonical purine NTP pyrophosphatase [Thermoleophilia bacterium]